jgi:hypothetical protein
LAVVAAGGPLLPLFLTVGAHPPRLLPHQRHGSGEGTSSSSLHSLDPARRARIRCGAARLPPPLPPWYGSGEGASSSSSSSLHGLDPARRAPIRRWRCAPPPTLPSRRSGGVGEAAGQASDGGGDIAQGRQPDPNLGLVRAGYGLFLFCFLFD